MSVWWMESSYDHFKNWKKTWPSKVSQRLMGLLLEPGQTGKKIGLQLTSRSPVMMENKIKEKVVMFSSIISHFPHLWATGLQEISGSYIMGSNF